MTTRPTLFLLALALLAFPTFAQNKKESPEVLTVNFCDLINQPSKYDRKVIRATAIYWSGYHGAGISDYSCDSGDASMEVGFEKSKIHRTKRSVGKKFDELINNVDGDERHRAEVTVVGRFSDWNGIGYGHLNWSRFSFAIMAFEKIEPVDASVQKSQNRDSEFMAQVENIRTLDLIWSRFYSGFSVEGANGLFADDYVFFDLQGKRFNWKQFSEALPDARNIKESAFRTGKVFIDGDKASTKQGGAISYACPNTVVSQFQYDNEYEKRDDVWKLIKTQITSDKASIKMSCF